MMVNLMRYRDQADYADGRDTELTGREADDLYFAPLDVPADIGAQVVLMAGDDRSAALRRPDHRGMRGRGEVPDAPVPSWMQPGTLRPPRPSKDAGMKATFIIAAQPFAPPTWDGEPRPRPGAAPLDRRGRSGGGRARRRLRLRLGRHARALATSIAHGRHQAAATIAVPHGVSIDAGSGPRATVVGDGRRWDQIHFSGSRRGPPSWRWQALTPPP